MRVITCFLLFNLSLLVCGRLVAQPMTSREIRAFPVVRDSASLDPVFVIQGYPYLLADSLKMDSALSAHHRNYLLDITLLRSEKIPSFHGSRDVIIIAFVTKQNSRDIRKQLRIAKRRLLRDVESFADLDSAAGQIPVIYIDGMAVPVAEANATIRRLKPSKVFAIINAFGSGNSLSTDQIPERGVVRIWLSKENSSHRENLINMN